MKNLFLLILLLSIVFIADSASNTCGAGWVVMDSGTTENLYGICGSSNTDVFSVSHSGTILHYNGTSWSEMESGTTNTLTDVWCASESDVFAVGAEGTILHYDGLNWSEMESSATVTLKCVWGSSGNDVFAGGGDGTLVHYDGSSWSEMEIGITYRNLLNRQELVEHRVSIRRNLRAAWLPARLSDWSGSVPFECPQRRLPLCPL